MRKLLLGWWRWLRTVRIFLTIRDWQVAKDIEDERELFPERR